MKAVQMTRAGGPDVLSYGEVPDPVLQSDTGLLIRVKAAGVNPVDAKQRGRGTWYPGSLPAILGLDGSGVVVKTGSKVRGFKEGDEVYFAYGGIGKEPGTYAESIVVEERSAARKPRALSFAEAAAAPCALITAWDGLFHLGRLQKGETVLVQAGAGGVGHLAVQLAALHGARVCATVGSEEKAELVRRLGAEKAVLYKKQDFVEEALSWTAGRGVDLAVDLVGKETFFKTHRAVRVYGRLAAMLGPDPAHADWQEARLRCLTVCFYLMFSPMYFGLPEHQQRQTGILKQAAALFESGRLSVHVSKTFPLREAAEAHRLIERGDATGKIVLLVDEG